MIEQICIIILLNLLFFAKTIRYKYVSDDIPSFQRKEKHKKLKRWLLVLEGHLKSNIQMDHFITTVLHALVCVFVYIGFGANHISFLAAMLFAFNPINNQGSVWISGRGYVLSALGMTMALSIPYIGVIFLILATYSNAGFLAPIALIGSDYSWMLLVMPFIWAIHFKRFRNNVAAKIKIEMFAEDKKIHPKKLLLAIKTFGFYTVHALIPIKTTFYHSYMQSMAGSGRFRAYSFKDRFLYIGLAIISFIIWRFTTQPWDMANFGILWWCICIAPFCNLFRLQQEIGERYCYLPNVGLMFFLACVLQTYPQIIPVFLAVYCTKLWFYMDSYTDDYFMVEQACINSPDSWFAWHVRGMKRWETKSYQEAVILWTMARMISPNEFKVNFNLSTALKLSGNVKEANFYFELAKNCVPPGQEKQIKTITDDWSKGNCAIVL